MPKFDATTYLETLREVSQFSRPTSQEILFMMHLTQELSKLDSTHEVISKSINGRPYYTFVRPRDTSKRSKYVFVVHVDETATLDEERFVRLENDWICSHSLDNSVSIALLLLLLRTSNVQVLFTTEEEINRSWTQVKDICLVYGVTPIGVDIRYENRRDVAVIPCNCIPTQDLSGPLDLGLVQWLWTLEPRSFTDGGATEIGELGHYTNLRGAVLLFNVFESDKGEEVYLPNVHKMHTLILMIQGESDTLEETT